ncbi:MAG: chromate efflux transporter subunit ChrB [Chloroflexota bacterium]
MIATLGELLWACLQVGALGFGGGNAAIPLLQAEAVPRWLTDTEFGELVGLNFALPGVTIIKLAGMVGWRAAGLPGLVVAVVGLATPGLLLTVAASGLLGRFRDHELVSRAVLAMQYAAAALLACSAFKLVASATGPRLPLQGLFIVALVFASVQFLKLAPGLAILVSVALGLAIL